MGSQDHLSAVAHLALVQLRGPREAISLPLEGRDLAHFNDCLEIELRCETPRIASKAVCLVIAVGCLREAEELDVAVGQHGQQLRVKMRELHILVPLSSVIKLVHYFQKQIF